MFKITVADCAETLLARFNAIVKQLCQSPDDKELKDQVITEEELQAHWQTRNRPVPFWFFVMNLLRYLNGFRVWIMGSGLDYNQISMYECAGASLDGEYPKYLIGIEAPADRNMEVWKFKKENGVFTGLAGVFNGKENQFTFGWNSNGFYCLVQARYETAKANFIGYGEIIVFTNTQSSYEYKSYKLIQQ